MEELIPALFLGHGSPMNAISRNIYTDAWQRIGRTLPRPKAILSISAHWFVGGTPVTFSANPRTIHDFGGFPDALYHLQYPAPGNPALARRVQQLLSPLDVTLDESWGLDHGTWSVLTHVYPAADIPVLQLGIDATKPAAFHFELGKALAPLRSEDVLILGSGNLVHNLRAYSWNNPLAKPYDWAERFEAAAKEKITAGDYSELIDYERMGTDAQLSIPTPEHYLPLLYILGTRQGDEIVSFPVDGFDGGSISMLSIQVGAYPTSET